MGRKEWASESDTCEHWARLSHWVAMGLWASHSASESGFHLSKKDDHARCAEGPHGPACGRHPTHGRRGRDACSTAPVLRPRARPPPASDVGQALNLCASLSSTVEGRKH